MKSLWYGILFIIVIGIGGFAYRNALERSAQPIACPVDALMCPDGTTVARTGLSCIFPACPPPNVALSDIGVAFALPDGFIATRSTEEDIVATYETNTVATEPGTITIRRYALASSTPLEVIKATAIGGASGLPINPTSFTSTELGTHRFTLVAIERFEGVVHVAYYLARGNDVLRFDAIDRGADWTNPSLDITVLPTQAALRRMLTTLQGE